MPSNGEDKFGVGKSQTHLCSICHTPFVGYGHNPMPVVDNVNARCCDACNQNVVLPARLRRMQRGQSAY